MNHKETVKICLAVALVMVIILFLSFVSFYIINKAIYPRLVALDVSTDSASVDSIPEMIAELEVGPVGTGAAPLRTPLLSLGEDRSNGQLRNVSVYNVGDINQCSGDPCIGASGYDICKLLREGINVCAANWALFGTVIEVEGMGECFVLDRMNSRFPEGVDWAMRKDEKHKALDFGRKWLKVKVLNK